MTETTSLLPPITGPMANPLLFGVAAGLTALFPLSEAESREREADEDRLGSATDAMRGHPSPSDA